MKITDLYKDYNINNFVQMNIEIYVLKSYENNRFIK